MLSIMIMVSFVNDMIQVMYLIGSRRKWLDV